MKSFDFCRCALCCATVAMLAPCGGSQPPVIASGAVRQTSALATHAEHGKSWMRPGTSGGDLLYASSTKSTSVLVFNYSSGKVVQRIKATALGLCSDSAGNVFMTNGTNSIDEYAHGGISPIATLYDAGNYPQACAIDPSTGNLAVVGAQANDATANVAIFPYTGSGFGTPNLYTDSSVNSFVWCAYDNAGDLFANASLGYKSEALDELAAGGSSLERVTINQTMSKVGSIQWDGESLAMADPIYAKAHGPAIIYQLHISGFTATVVGKTKLSGPRNKNDSLGPQLAIQDGSILYAESIARNVGSWQYPQGGRPTRKFRVPARPWGLTFSRGS
jgi:hypothetical protein